MRKNLLYLLSTFVIGAFTLFGCASTGQEEEYIDEFAIGDEEIILDEGEVEVIDDLIAETVIIDETAFAEEPSIRSVTETVAVELRAIHFAFDGSALSEEARSILKTNADYLIANPNINIVIEGHCDDRGTVAYNLALGQRRAVRVKEYYVGLGVAAARVATISYGKEQPVEFGENEMAWAANRRAETKIIQ
ncbi:MAG: OmpA family protein [Elusimicrobiota bacterium]|nr:OmpA family protein [Elusimicrobiota bacterium]